MTSPSAAAIMMGYNHASSSKKMGLLPLEFADCLLDSPYFRENLRAHEKQLDQTSADIKGIIKDVQDVVEAAKTVSKAKRTLASSLANFQFDCLGTSLTDDEIIIANSLKEFARFLNEVEDEMDRMLEHAHEKFIQPLVDFRKEQIGSVKKTKKDFDKATSRFCTAQDNYIKMKKEESLAEAAEAVRHDQKSLRSASLIYVYEMHVVQERKKFEFVEALLSFMHSWSNYYRFGQEKTETNSNYMNDLRSRVQKCRTSFDATKDSYESLKNKMATDTSQDPGVFNPMYTRQGYLYVQSKSKAKPFNVVGSAWTKNYCQYQAKTKTLTMIPYNQLNGKITTTETVRVTSCLCKSEDSAEKFRFVVHGEDLAQNIAVTYTLQAMTEFERKHWVESLGGTWPAVNSLQMLRADSVEDNLNSMAFTFLKDCLAELETRGLTDQGLYRVGGVVSKVKKLLNEGLGIGGSESCFDLSDPKQWESKTIASAVKQYFRDLNKPLMTHTLYTNFVEAVKTDKGEETRLELLVATMKKLPVANREMLKVLIKHLAKVAAKHEVNLMTAANLGVVFGPTLLRPKEETVASIMDIKFCNEVVQILIENCDNLFFPSHLNQSNTDSSSPESPTKSSKARAPPVPNSRETRGSSTPKRTHSFSSFSQLSTNSLPDIKELHPTVLTIANGHHGHHHHHHRGHHYHQDVPDSKTSRLKKAPSRDDDLMASLEMMESLAADLPLNVSPNGNGNTTLKRSYTVQHRGNKPPLPKMSSPMLSDSSSTGSNHSFKQVLTPSKFHQQNSGASSPNIYPTSSPKLNRPKELFVRQITLPMDNNNKLETPIVPSPSIGSPTKHQAQPPPIPARRFPRAYHQVISTKDSDSGILTSPSPPAIKSKSKTEIDDNLSISSESDSTGSRYDNVIHPRRFSNDTNSSSKTSTLVAAAAEIAAQRASKEISTQTLKIEENFDGDDEDEETSDCSSDILVLDSSSSETHGPKDNKKRFFNDELDDDIHPVEQHENHNDEIEISDHFCTSRIESSFTLPGAVPSSLETTPRSSPASSPNQQTNSKQKHHHFHHHHHHHTGHHHQELEPANIKRLLAAGPTSNV